MTTEPISRLQVPFATFFELFEWDEGAAEYPLLLEIYRFCNLLFLSGLEALVHITVDAADAPRHPHPDDCSDGGLVDYWGDEVGASSPLTETARKSQGNFFMAVACAGRFSGVDQPEYTQKAPTRSFPSLVRTTSTSSPTPSNGRCRQMLRIRRSRSFEAYRNLSVIGCEAIEKPSGGSHYKARFPGNRPWVLDPNVDPVAERFIGQLPQITGFPTPVVKYALKRGQLPPRKLRLGTIIAESAAPPPPL